MNSYIIRNQFDDAKKYFPNIELRPTTNGKIYVKGALQPASQQFYIISIYFPNSYPNAMPSVCVDKPTITAAPHQYNNGPICYLHPSMWNPGRHNLSFVIQRAAKWLSKYEVWKQKRVWPGKSIPH